MDAMGLPDLNREIADLRTSPQVPARRLGQQLKARRDFLREQVRDYVEKQFLLNADVSGKRLREELLRKIKLSNVEHRNFRLIQEIVYKMAKKTQRPTQPTEKNIQTRRTQCAAHPAPQHVL
jgi:hypothetical protein